MRSGLRTSLMLLILLALLGTPMAAHDDLELGDGRWFTLYNQKHQVLLRTGIRIHVGDKFLDRDNRMYQVYKVDSRRFRAWAKQVDNYGTFTAPVQSDGLAGADNKLVAVYHTHSGESYEPSDGVASTDTRQGGVYRVGDQFSQRLEKDEVHVLHCQDTFFPYAGSYRRSRLAAQDLTAEGLDAIFDVHRDAAPWGEYFQEIEDMQLTQVMLVVGTQNPAFRTNEEFAWQLKEVADAMYPDLVKGVFYARGDYNQDLHPRALLLEIGAHANSRYHAEVGARAFADVVFATLYGTKNVPPADEEIQKNRQLQPTANPPAARQGGLGKGVLTLFGLLGFGGIFYLFISVGSWEGVRGKLVDFWEKEFHDLAARIPWGKLDPRYIFAQFKEIKVGSGGLKGFPEQIRHWWERRRNRL